MSTIDEKRVYGARADRTDLLVATAAGLAAVEVSGGQVGRFRLAHDCVARDLAAAEGEVAVATDGDVLVSTGEGYDGTGFGPAVAVGATAEGIVAAGPDGRVARRVDGGWRDLGTVPDVRAIDGDLLGAADGVYRLAGGEPARAGLSDVRDVAAGGAPLAATGSGLYRLANGWVDVLEGAFEVVTADRAGGAAAPGRAHAATAAGFYEHAEGEWVERDLPVAGRVADLAYGAGVYAVTADGTLLADAGDGWRSRALGLGGAAALAVG